MKIIGVLAITLFSSWITCFGQVTEEVRSNALSFEVGKTGLIYSISLDHRLKNNLGFRVLTGTNFSNYLRAFSIFGGGYYLVGKNKSTLELGLDLGYLSVDQRSDDQRSIVLIFPNYDIRTYYVNLNIGYRRYGKKTLFRFGAAPGYSKSGPLPGGYISYGITF